MTTLDTKQREAVDSDFRNPTLVIGAPGTGKTTVIVHRIVRFLQTTGTLPEYVLVVVRSNNDVSLVRRELALLLDNNKAERVRILTPFDLVRSYARVYFNHLALNPNFTILSDDQASAMVEEQVTRAAQDYVINNDEQRYSDRDHIPLDKILDAMSKLGIQNMAERIDYAANYGVFPNHVREVLRWKSAASGIYSGYLASLKAMNATTVPIMNLRVSGIVGRNTNDGLVAIPCLRSRENTFNLESPRAIFVDEFQDLTNAQRGILISLCRNRKATIAASFDASINDYIGSSNDFMIEIKSKLQPFNLKTITLSANHRNNRAIASCALGVIRSQCRGWKEEREFDFANIEEPNPPQLHKVRNQGEEAGFVVTRIRGLIESGVSPDRIGVFGRNLRSLEHVKRAMATNEIKYNEFGGQSIWNTRIVKDIVSWLHVAINVLDVYAIATSSSSGFHHPISRAVLKNICDGGNLGSSSQFMFGVLTNIAKQAGVRYTSRYMVSNSQKSYINEYVDAVNAILSGIRNNQRDIIDLVIQQSGYKLTESTKEIVSVLSDIYHGACDNSSTGIDNVSTFMDTIERNRIIGERVGNGKVTVDVMHYAKMDEYDYVFVVNCVSGVIPVSSHMTDAEDGDKDEGEGYESECRLFYSTILRARKGLFLMYPEKNVSPMSDEFGTYPSPFIIDAADYGAVWS